jgi:hypothetical protein
MGAKRMPRTRILAADIGTTSTHVCLLDSIESSYRLVARGEAPTTASDVGQDIMTGLVLAIRQIERAVSFPILDSNLQLISADSRGEGSPCAFYATLSAAPPLRVVIAGAKGAPNPSARRACLLPVVELAGMLELGPVQPGDADWLTELDRLLPDVIVLVGGSDDTRHTIIKANAQRLLSLYAKTDAHQRPTVLFAGGQPEACTLSQMVSSGLDLRCVAAICPTRSSEDLGGLRLELMRLYEQTKLTQLEGYQKLMSWCSTPPQASCRALETLYRFLSGQDKPDQAVLGVDVGGASNLIFTQDGSAVPILFGTHEGTYFTAAAEDDGIRRWLPPAKSSEDTLLAAQQGPNQSAASSENPPDSLVELGTAHEALIGSIHRWQETHGGGGGTANLGNIDRLYSRGGVFVHTENRALGLLTILDALQPTGITQVFLDSAEIWPQLGMVASGAPQAAVDVLEQDGLGLFGTIIAPSGSPTKAGQALHLAITCYNGQCDRFSIPGGVIQRIVYPKDEILTILIDASPHWDLGYGRQRQVQAKVRSGEFGIILDTRGRPLAYSKAGLSWRTRVEGDIQSLTSSVHLIYPQTIIKRGQQS